jgi:hypothetical protein
MATHRGDEWDSDGDSDEGGQVTLASSILLGVPDGIIKDSEDLYEPLVSKIGGPPVSFRGILHSCTYFVLGVRKRHFTSHRKFPLHHLFSSYGACYSTLVPS